ncbi:MAG: PGPGW domain-containing protein [Pseudomonadota bacterium]
MDIFTDLLAWFEAHPRIVIGVGVFSVLSFFATLAALPWLVTRIPSDYFLPPKRRKSHFALEHPMLRWDILILRNLVGFVIFLLGLVMIATPGPGLITILAGLILMNYPGKYRLERWIIQRPPLLRTVNRLRAKHGAQPLEF